MVCEKVFETVFALENEVKIVLNYYNSLTAKLSFSSSVKKWRIYFIKIGLPINIYNDLASHF